MNVQTLCTHYAKTANFKSNLTRHHYIIHYCGWTYNAIDWKLSVVQLLLWAFSMVTMLQSSELLHVECFFWGELFCSLSITSHFILAETFILSMIFQQKVSILFEHSKFHIQPSSNQGQFFQILVLVSKHFYRWHVRNYLLLFKYVYTKSDCVHFAKRAMHWTTNTLAPSCSIATHLEKSPVMANYVCKSP